MKEFLMVFVGGGMGSAFRFWLGQASYLRHSTFPYATLTANLLACFILGVTIFCLEKISPSGGLKQLMAIGFCGGLSTFSTFEADLFQLQANKELFTMAGYLVISLVLGFVALWLGMKLASLFF